MNAFQMRVDPLLEPDHVRAGWAFFDACKNSGAFMIDAVDPFLAKCEDGNHDWVVRFDPKLSMEVIFISPFDEEDFRQMLGQE